MGPGPDLKPVLARLAAGETLSADEAEAAFGAIMAGAATPAQIAGFIVGLRVKKETIGEIAAAAQVMRELATHVEVKDDRHLVDTCGTGGDGHHTLNVSTAVSLVVAASGVPVAKHGNRAASSKAGAADTLEQLGLDMEAAGRTADKTLAEL